MDNALTIDVEDYYMVSSFADKISYDDWGSLESRVERNTQTILNLLDEYKVKATFFVLGWVCNKYPKLVKEIHQAGHEVASHGYSHRLIYNLTRNEFREDIRRAKESLEDTIGAEIYGFRAASYSIIRETLWALDILMEEGYIYDSSIFPVHHDRYGMPDSDRFPHTISRNGAKIQEFPLSTYRIFGLNIPVAGGGYMRLLPLYFMKKAINSINKAEKKPFILYLHPWEIDPNQPRIKGTWISNIRHYQNIKSAYPKLEALLKGYKFKPLAEFISDDI